jgi:multiple sugar transport system permease protein
MDVPLKITQPMTGQAGARGYHRRKAARDRRAFLIFVAPAILAFVLMMLWPLISMFYLSLVEWQGLVKPKTFVGLDNFFRLAGDRHFHRALLNTGIHILVSMPGVMLPAFVLGFFLNQRRRGYRLMRIIFFSPAMISVTAIAMMFVGVYLPEGILNTLLSAAGLDSWTRPWLGNSSTVLLAIIAIDLYGGIGYYAVLFSAALTGVSSDLYESALLDGAGHWTTMWRIGFPLILPFFGVASMLHLLWILMGAAQNVLLLTQGGPGDYSLTLGYYLYQQAFKSYQLGYSQTIGVAIFVIGVTGMLLIRKATHRNYQE